MVVRLADATAAVRWITARLGELDGTRWLGIDGFGASGKSTLAAAIAAALPGSVLVPIDDFGRPGVRGWEQARFMDQVVRPLLAGRDARYQRWDWHRDAGAEWHDVPADRLVICEGVSSTDVAVPVPWDLTVWVEASYEVRRARARERDGEAMEEVWLTDWLPNEQAYAAAQRPWERADLIVAGVSETAAQ